MTTLQRVKRGDDLIKFSGSHEEMKMLCAT